MTDPGHRQALGWLVKQSSPKEMLSVTLNITPVARWLMCQGSDFRLTSIRNGTRTIESHTAQKQFILHYPKWSGLVCYTGIALYDDGRGFRHDTATWLQSVLEHSPDQQRSPEDVVRALREANTWLRRIPADQRFHTFTMLAYDKKGVPRVWVLSTFERPGQPPKTVGEDDLLCTRIRVSVPQCIVTGWTPAVSKAQQDALLDKLAQVPDRDVMSDAVAIVNREASANAANTVSPESIVAVLSPDGSGQVTVYGSLLKEFLPCVILRGMSLDVSPYLTQQGLTDQMLDAVSWPPRSQTLGGNTAMCQSFRSISGYKWPDDPTATPRKKVPVKVDFKPEPNN
jgi:hypothetical protein